MKSDNLNGKLFSKDELSLSDWQQGIKHHSSKEFKIGERVFLNSNPEVELIVDSIHFNKVNCIVVKTDDEVSFLPECLSKYKYASILKSNQFLININ